MILKNIAMGMSMNNYHRLVSKASSEDWLQRLNSWFCWEKLCSATLISFSLLLLSGCISTPKSQIVTMAPGVTLQLTAPPVALQMHSQTQLIEAKFNGDTQSLIAQVEYSATEIKLVAMTPSGIPLFEVLWSVDAPAVIQQYVPVPNLDISYVIADLQWVSWPLGQLQLATTATLTQVDDGSNWVRTLTQDEQVILTIEKSDNRYVLKHLLRGYQITITELNRVTL